MKPATAASALGLAWLSLLGCPGASPPAARRLQFTREVDRALATLAERVTPPEATMRFRDRTGKDWNQSIRNLKSGTVTLKERYDIQHTVDGNFKPVPVTPNGLKPILFQPANPLAPPLEKAEEVQLLQKARSVGRLLKRTCPNDVAGCFEPIGTLFMINRDIAATNCHVVEQFVERDNSGKWRLKADKELRADFAFGRTVVPSNQFRLTALAGCSPFEGFDVALIKLVGKSVNGLATLPPPLEIEKQPVQRNWGLLDARVQVIGYPDWHEPKEADIVTLKQAGDFGRIASPGVITSTIPHGAFHYLLHNSTTGKGNSGSPLIDMQTYRVIGVHSCCVDTSTVTLKKEPACATIVGDPVANLALPAWYIASDPELKAFLP